MMVAVFLLGVAFICLLLYFLRSEGLPPGDWGYPVIGNLIVGRENLGKLINDQKAKYGDIFSVRFGSMTVVYIADYHLIKEAFSKTELSGRPKTIFFQVPINFTGYGITQSQGHIWQVNRRFAIQTLRDFGLGSSIVETVIEKEIEELVAEFSKRVNQPTDIDWTVNVATLNVIWKLVANKRYSITDKEVHKVWKVFQRGHEIFNGNLVFLDFFPWLDKLLPQFLKNRFMHMDELNKIYKYLHSVVRSNIEDHLKNFDKQNPKDYIDKYLLNVENGVKESSGFLKDMDNLLYSIYNLFIAGTETTSSTLRWFFLYMCKYPDIQEKIQKDIDTIVPKDRRPTMQDRENLAFLEATIHEVNRMASVVATGLSHAALQNTVLNGYKIPKGTVISPLVESCHRNPKYFVYPDKFYPERFLDKNGKVDTQKEGYLPFSTGRRICPGEALAMTELFLFTSTILQEFKVQVHEDCVLDLAPCRKTPIFNYPPQCKIILKKRK